MQSLSEKLDHVLGDLPDDLALGIAVVDHLGIDELGNRLPVPSEIFELGRVHDLSDLWPRGRVLSLVVPIAEAIDTRRASAAVGSAETGVLYDSLGSRTAFAVAGNHEYFSSKIFVRFSALRIQERSTRKFEWSPER